MRVLALQPDIMPSDTRDERNQNIDVIVDKLEHILDDNDHYSIDLLVLPELCTIDYSRYAFERLKVLSESLQGYSVDALSVIAKKYKTFVSFGFPRSTGDKYRISNVVLNEKGCVISYYDKLHIAQFGASIEKEYFDKGEGVCVFSLKNFKVGVVICYDFRFSEYLRVLVHKHKVDFIIHPVAFTEDETFRSWHDFVVTRALENQVYFLSLNRAGDAWGNSIFCPPWVGGNFREEKFGKSEEYRLFDLDIEDIKMIREKYSFNHDRVECYESLRNIQL